jgi:hypothetical protein
MKALTAGDISRDLTRLLKKQPCIMGSPYPCHRHGAGSSSAAGAGWLVANEISRDIP